MGTDLLATEISHGFDHLDVDGDWQLTERDHVLCGRRVAAPPGHAEGSEGQRKIVDAYPDTWRNLDLPHLPEGNTAISKKDLVASTAGLAGNPNAAAATVGPSARVFLEIADTDRDGRVSPAEFLVFQRGHFPGLTEAEADEAFTYLDTDGDGSLPAEEFVRAITECWSSTGPDAPGNWWTGRPGHL
ncbi:EF-hand domain-containing protein [Streptomyces sp. NPDC014773]|uniref:EF-hand domain-containing protein n=1 Tax=Streptomyces sp. NPDC014773 TaxID=3364908 RepID=UPI003702FDD2